MGFEPIPLRFGGRSKPLKLCVLEHLLVHLELLFYSFHRSPFYRSSARKMEEFHFQREIFSLIFRGY